MSGSAEYNSHAQTSEVIDMTNENYTCKNFAHLPVNVSRATGGVLGTNVIVCGGQFFDFTKPQSDMFLPVKPTIVEDCYKINQDVCNFFPRNLLTCNFFTVFFLQIHHQEEAVLFVKMKEKRSGASSIVYNNKLWITGGKNVKVVHVII